MSALICAQNTTAQIPEDYFTHFGDRKLAVFFIKLAIAWSFSQNSFNESHSFVESVTLSTKVYMSMWARLGRFL
jgi:hypothetical protein